MKRTIKWIPVPKSFPGNDFSVTVLLCLPLLVKVDHLRAGLLHLLHGSGASLWHTGTGGDGAYPQPWWEKLHIKIRKWKRFTWCQTWSLHHIRHTNCIWIFCPLNKENIGEGRRSSCTEYAINIGSTTGIKIPFTNKSPALIIVTEKLHNSTSYRLLTRFELSKKNFLNIYKMLTQ